MISTKDLSGLPNAERLKNFCKGLAALDIIMVEEEWSFIRHYTYDPAWRKGKEAFFATDGSDQSMIVMFAPAVCAVAFPGAGLAEGLAGQILHRQARPGRKRMLPADEKAGLLQQQLGIAHTGAMIQRVVKGDDRIQPAIKQLLQQGRIIQPRHCKPQSRMLTAQLGDHVRDLIQSQIFQDAHRKGALLQIGRSSELCLKTTEFSV